MMTDPDIASGSGRACAAALALPEKPGMVVNLQGDAPFIPPEIVAQLIVALRASRFDAATAVVRLAWNELDALRAHKLASPSSGTTCVSGPDGRAIWFSKSIIPAIRDEMELRRTEARSPVLGHLGLYAYRLEALERFERAPVSAYERLEGLEQLRFLELGLSMLAVEIPPSPHVMAGIDTPQDVAWAEAVMAEHGDPHERWGQSDGQTA
jgi:3-deoxy-manno-octulosonate cytidylyltransferase (CMP-KDO synthetase)